MTTGALVIGTFFLLMLAGVPVTISIGAASIGGLWLAGFGTDFLILTQQLVDGVQRPALFAIPFFILTGNLMNAIGLTDRIFNMALAFVGHFRAGLAQVNVLASLLFAGISGSATADIAGLGQLEVKAMRDRGYTLDFSAALTVVTSIVGPIIPPSISLIVYAWLSNTSVARLFVAGIVPGLVLGIAFMIYIRVLAIWKPFPREPRATLPALGVAIMEGMPALLAPALIMSAMIFGYATATEAGVLACVLSILLGVFYRSVSFVGIWKAMCDTAALTSFIMMIIGFSQAMGWVLAVEQVPQAFAAGLLSAIDGRVGFLLFVIALLLLVGCFMEATPAKIILVPLLLPAADFYGVDRVHFGFVVTLSLLVGLATPPFGVGLYVMSSLVNISLERLALAVLPMLVPVLIVLLLIAFVPSLTLFLPNLILGAE